ncbi:hypothetical protein HK405_004918 [Cladochytrium tenue]|nr:hypothetical protein HK405_004918 [Cladochytrium tenue]
MSEHDAPTPSMEQAQGIAANPGHPPTASSAPESNQPAPVDDSTAAEDRRPSAPGVVIVIHDVAHNHSSEGNLADHSDNEYVDGLDRLGQSARNTAKRAVSVTGINEPPRAGPHSILKPANSISRGLKKRVSISRRPVPSALTVDVGTADEDGDPPSATDPFATPSTAAPESPQKDPFAGSPLPVELERADVTEDVELPQSQQAAEATGGAAEASRTGVAAILAAVPETKPDSATAGSGSEHSFAAGVSAISLPRATANAGAPPPRPISTLGGRILSQASLNGYNPLLASNPNIGRGMSIAGGLGQEEGAPGLNRANTTKTNKSGWSARRMSLGAALCIPPPPRIDDTMNFKKFTRLSLGAIGIVYGDIAVSPIFVLKSIFFEDSAEYASGDTHDHLDESRVLAVLSFLFWVITFVCCLKYIVFVLKVASFQESEKLADIFGIGVTGTMISTTIFYITAMQNTWGKPKWQTALFAATFLSQDALLLFASLRKVTSNGWITILLGLALFLFMHVWHDTTFLINTIVQRDHLIEISELRIYVRAIHRTQGTVVYVANMDEDVPNVLRICAQRLRSLPENIVCMSAVAANTPFVSEDERYLFRTVDASAGIYRLVISYGYAERSIDTVTAVERARKRGLRVKPEEKVTFVVGRELVTCSRSETTLLQRLQVAAFTSIGANTQGMVDYFNLPPSDTLEIGTLLEL